MLRGKTDNFMIKFSEEERALLRKRAKAEKMTEADHLRACMVLEAVYCGDLDGLKILGSYMRDLLQKKLPDLRARGLLRS